MYSLLFPFAFVNPRCCQKGVKTTTEITRVPNTLFIQLGPQAKDIEIDDYMVFAQSAFRLYSIVAYDPIDLGEMVSGSNTPPTFETATTDGMLVKAVQCIKCLWMNTATRTKSACWITLKSKIATKT